MSSTGFIAWVGLCLTLVSLGSEGSVGREENSPLWLSGTPPNMEMMKQFSRAHGGMVIRDEERNYSKMLWLRAGDDLKKANYLSDKMGQFYLLDVKSNASQPAPSSADSAHTAIKFKMPDEGYYNAYYMEQNVRDGVRYVDVAKREVLKHNCQLGHDFDVEQHRPQSAKQIPLEVLRLRFDDETYHTRFNSGKNVLFKVLYKGDPVANAAVTISTEEGWSRNSKTDSEGIVSFLVIQDRFKQNEAQEVEKKQYKPKQTEGARKYKKEGKSEHKQAESGGSHGRMRRRSEEFLVTVQYREPSIGEIDGLSYEQSVYTTTFPGHFSPSQSAYKSYAYGLTFGSAGFLVLGIGSYMYRRRRIKPFKEVNLDD